MLYCCNNIIFKSLDSVFKFELYSLPVCGREDENRQTSREKEWMVSSWVMQQRETKTVFLCFNSLTSLFWSEMIEAFNISVCASRKCKSVCVTVQSAARWHKRSHDFVAYAWPFPISSLRVWCAHWGARTKRYDSMQSCAYVGSGPRDKKAPELKTFSIFCARVAAVT